MTARVRGRYKKDARRMEAVTFVGAVQARKVVWPGRQSLRFEASDLQFYLVDGWRYVPLAGPIRVETATGYLNQLAPLVYEHGKFSLVVAVIATDAPMTLEGMRVLTDAGLIIYRT